MSETSEPNRFTDVLAVLDVGHGNAAVLLDSGSVVVFDAGPGSILLEFLREQSITHVDTVLLSHADKDHIGGLCALLASGTVSIGKVRANTDSLKGSNAWDDLAFELSRNAEVNFLPVLTTENSGEFDTPTVEIEIAGPSTYLASRGAGSTDRENRSLSTNSLSAVVRLKHKENAFALLPGDLDFVGLQNLLEEEHELTAGIMVFPHHGGRPGTSRIDEFVQTLLKAAQPNTVLFSIGRGKHGTPRPEIINAIRRHFPHVRIACSQLSEHCAKTISKPMNDSHLAAIHAQGKVSHSCCAGSMIFDFASGTFQPSHEAHKKFINLEAETPLCKSD